jgi:uncharacterized protein YbaR (Trm112 family)
MVWTREQIELLYDGVYRNRMVCPGCGGRLAVERSGEAGVFGVVSCDACGGRHRVSGENDPLRETFREFTEAEVKGIKKVDRARGTPVCPVDGTAMEVNAQRSLGRTSNVVVRCRRCARGVEFVRMHG